MRVYLDNSCYNRLFEDQKQMHIRLGAEARLGIPEMILEMKVERALHGFTYSTLRRITA